MRLRILGLGGRERQQPVDQAVSFSIPKVDPDEQRIIFIAHDTRRVTDDGIASEIDAVFKDRDVDARRSLTRRVLEVRHPEIIDTAGKIDQDNGEGPTPLR